MSGATPWWIPGRRSGSCAQIGANCHLSGGVGIGGVLEPLQANPVIIEDDCFVGARSEVAEGVVVERGSVLSMGVFIGASTKVIDRATGEIHMGRVPAYSVVVPGSLPGRAAAGRLAGPIAVLRRDRQDGGCADAGEDLDQRVVARLICDRLCTIPLPACAGADPLRLGHARPMPARRTCWPTRCEQLGFTVTPAALRRDREPVRPHRHRIGRISALPAIPTWFRSAPPNWQIDPFAGEVRDGVLYGRGACDMKGGIAAFVAAAAQHLADGPPRGSISLLITGDEEGPAVDGTVRVLEWMQANDQIPDFCVVGEPTCPVTLGDMVKIGRRGSLNAKITVHGTQGHVAYPHRADNPVHRLVRIADCADRRAARCRQRVVPAIHPAVHQHRRRQPGDQRHPGRGARDAEHPLQRATTPARRCRHGCAR